MIGAVAPAVCLLWLALMPAGGAAAQDYLESNRAWHGYRGDEAGRPVCYMVSAPVDQVGNYTDRGDAYAMVALRPNGPPGRLVGFALGYRAEAEGEVTVSVDGAERFVLRIADGGAGAPGTSAAYPSDGAFGQRLVEAMRGGAELDIEATSAGGTPTRDRYSLFGFTATYQAIEAACG